MRPIFLVIIFWGMVSTTIAFAVTTANPKSTSIPFTTQCLTLFQNAWNNFLYSQKLKVPLPSVSPEVRMAVDDFMDIDGSRFMDKKIGKRVLPRGKLLEPKDWIRVPFRNHELVLFYKLDFQGSREYVGVWGLGVVAVKEIHEASESTMLTYIREYDRLLGAMLDKAGIRHPEILSYIPANGKIYIISKYIPGADFKQLYEMQRAGELDATVWERPRLDYHKRYGQMIETQAFKMFFRKYHSGKLGPGHRYQFYDGHWYFIDLI